MFYFVCNVFLFLESRLQVSLDTPEPRIHFALVCGAKSCPPIKTYSSEVCVLYLKIKRLLNLCELIGHMFF